MQIERGRKLPSSPFSASYLPLLSAGGVVLSAGAAVSDDLAATGFFFAMWCDIFFDEVDACASSFAAGGVADGVNGLPVLAESKLSEFRSSTALSPAFVATSLPCGFMAVLCMCIFFADLAGGVPVAADGAPGMTSAGGVDGAGAGAGAGAEGAAAAGAAGVGAGVWANDANGMAAVANARNVAPSKFVLRTADTPMVVDDRHGAVRSALTTSYILFGRIDKTTD